jgi:hypothetical protein
MPVFREARWRPIAQGLLDAVEEQHVGPQSSVSETVADWLHDFFDAHPPLEGAEDGLRKKRPWRDHEGRLYLRLDVLGDWLRFARGQRLTDRRLATSLRASGLVCRRVHAGTSTCSAWQLPAQPGVIG